MTRFNVISQDGMPLFEVIDKDGVYLNETVSDVCEYLHLHQENFTLTTNNLGVMMWVRKPNMELPVRKLTIRSKV